GLSEFCRGLMPPLSPCPHGHPWNRGAEAPSTAPPVCPVCGADGTATRAATSPSAEGALREQTGLLRSILDSMGEGLVVADENGRFLLFNATAERILGLGLAEVSPLDWTAHYGIYLPDTVTPHPPEDLPLARAIRGEEVEEAELFVRNPARPQGLWLSVNASPLRDGRGALKGGVVVFRDITAHKRAEEQLRQSQANLTAL